MSLPGEKKKLSPKLCGGGGLYGVRHPLTSYVTRWSISAMMTTHYETSTMSMMLRLPCWSSHIRVRHMAEWFTVVRVDSVYLSEWIHTEWIRCCHDPARISLVVLIMRCPWVGHIGHAYDPTLGLYPRHKLYRCQIYTT